MTPEIFSASNANLLEGSKTSANTSISFDNSLLALILIKDKKTLPSMFSSKALLSLRIRIFFLPLVLLMSKSKSSISKSVGNILRLILPSFPSLCFLTVSSIASLLSFCPKT